MLALRPNCECCDTNLSALSEQALICTFECTFCTDCSEKLHYLCPNCGGNLVQRPIRPAAQLLRHPASITRIIKTNGCADAN